MYHYKLKIVILSKDELLINSIKSIKIMDNFTYDFFVSSEFNEELVFDSDVVIIDIPVDNIGEIRKKCGLKTKIVVSLPNIDLSLVDETLNKPFDYELVKFRILKVIERIKLFEDCNFTEDCLNTLIDASPDMIWIKTLDGIHTKVNKKFCEVVGKEKCNVEGHDHFSIWNVSKDDPNSGADVCKKTEDEVIAAGETRKFQEKIKINNNEPRQLDTYKTPFYDKNGKCLGTVGFGHDVTDLKNLSAVNGVFFENVPYPALIRNNNNLIVDVNPFFEKYFGVEKVNLIDKSYDEWAENTFYPERTTNESGFIEGVTLPINGIKKTAELRFTDIPDIFGNATGQICIFRDVTIERKLERENYNNSITDAMTGLYNRRYFTDFMENQKGLISFLAVDLDHFKSVNDNYGHQMGDKAIIMTANILKFSFPADTVVRMGGDEFLVVKVGENSMESLKNEAQNLLDSLNENFSNVLEFKELSASMGIAQGDITELGIEALMKHSDDALYKAKDIGRACYCVYGEDV